MPRRKKKRGEPAPGWAWMLFGLSIGLAVALVVYLRNALPDIARPESQSARVSAPQPVIGPEATTETQTSEASGPGNDGDDDNNDLSFYTELIDSEVIVADDEFDFGIEADSSQAILIQAGAFPDLQRADRRQAELALLGIESEIEHATVDGRVYYRILIGPVADRGETNRILRRLRQAGIENFARQVAN